MFKKLFLAVLGFTPLIVSGQPTCLLGKVSNQAIVSIQGQYLDYDETNGGDTVLDGVRGVMPGLNLQIMKTFMPVYVEISSQFFKGEMEYHGGYTDANNQFVSLSEDTINSILKLDAKLGYVFLYRPGLQFIPYLQLGYRQWERKVPPVYSINNIGINGITEEYDNFYYALGGKWIWQVQNNIVIVPRIAIGNTLNPTMNTHLPTSIGYFMDADFHLGTKMYYEAGVTAYYFITDLMNINFGMSDDYFGFGRSQKIFFPGTSKGFYEPNSHTNEFNVSLGVGFSFG